MAAKTTGWINLPGDDHGKWLVEANWDFGVAVAGDTVDIKQGDAPTLNLPDAGTFNFEVKAALTVTLDNWLAGASIGNVLVNHESADVTCTAAVTGTTTVTAGILTVAGNLGDDPADTVTIGASGSLQISGPITIAGAVANGGVFQVVAPFAITCAGLFTNNGLVDAMADSSIDFNGGVAGGGTWGTGEFSVLTLVSSADFNLMSATWNVAPGSSLTMDSTGTLNLGNATAANLEVYINGTATTLGASFSCYSFKSTGATPVLTGAGKTVTVGAGGLAQGGMTLAVAADLNVTVAESCNVSWPTAASLLGTLNVATGKTATQTESVALRSKTGDGTLASAAQTTYWLPNAVTDVCDGPITGTGVFYVQPATSGLVIPSSLNLGTRPVTYNKYATQNLTLSGLACGALTVAPGTDNTLTLTINGNSSGTTIVLGAGDLRYGILVLGSGYTHTWTSLAKGSTGTANGLTCGGKINVGGDQTLAGLAVDGGDARISGTAASKSLIGTSATSITHGRARVRGFPHPLTLTGLDTNWGAGKQRIRAWRCVDGGGNGDRVQFRRGHNLRAHSLDRSD